MAVATFAVTAAAGNVGRGWKADSRSGGILWHKELHLETCLQQPGSGKCAHGRRGHGHMDNMGSRRGDRPGAVASRGKEASSLQAILLQELSVVVRRCTEAVQDTTAG